MSNSVAISQAREHQREDDENQTFDEYSNDLRQRRGLDKETVAEYANQAKQTAQVVGAKASVAANQAANRAAEFASQASKTWNEKGKPQAQKLQQQFRAHKDDKVIGPVTKQQAGLLIPILAALLVVGLILGIRHSSWWNPPP